MIFRGALRFLLLGFRAVLHSLPDGWRKTLRRQHGLMGLYSRALHLSHLFYGMLPKHKLQARYNKLIKQQQAQLELLQAGSPSNITANCVVLAHRKEGLSQTLACLDKIASLESVFVISKDNADVQSQFSQYPSVQFISEASEVSHDLPLIIVRSGELLHPLAVYGYLSAVTHHELTPSPCVITADTDRISESGLRSDPECYPNWDPDLQLASGYINSGICVVGETLQSSLIDELLETQHEHGIALWLMTVYFSKMSVDYVHVPISLLHRQYQTEKTWWSALSERQKTQQWPIKLRADSEGHNAVVQWPINPEPLVSIIIPTRNAKALVKTCIESIFTKTGYKNYEILLIDNQSDDPAALAYFQRLDDSEPKVRVIKYPHAFNYSAINNYAVSQARGDVIALVNNDIEVISPDWLEYMVGHVCRPEIGCVGAKLYYPNRRIQHAGVVLGYGGGAGHAHKYFPDYHQGYLKRLACSNAYSAVTAACLLVSREDFEAVGGLNENDLTVAFNDVDLCLNIAQLGRRNLYCAEAELFHHESVSRGTENTPEKRLRFERELDYLKKHWADYIQADPAYNPNLTLKQENFALKE